MRTANQLPVWLLLCAFFLLTTACPKEPARINMVVSAANNVNPDPGGKPLSVVVRIYQLKDKGRLETADYNSLVKADTILAEDVLEKQERVIQPGTQETIEVQANPMATYVGVVALFRSPTGDTWRKIVPIRGKLLKLNINLQEHSIDVVSSGK